VVGELPCNCSTPEVWKSSFTQGEVSQQEGVTFPLYQASIILHLRWQANRIRNFNPILCFLHRQKPQLQ